MELGDFLLLAPRRLRALFPIALIAAIHFFPGQTEALFWARVKAEAHQVTSVFRAGISAALSHPPCTQAHHCRR
jgi:membrane protein YqaA with SNARE-associated domain